MMRPVRLPVHADMAPRWPSIREAFKRISTVEVTEPRLLLLVVWALGEYFRHVWLAGGQAIFLILTSCGPGGSAASVMSTARSRPLLLFSLPRIPLGSALDEARVEDDGVQNPKVGCEGQEQE